MLETCYHRTKSQGPRFELRVSIELSCRGKVQEHGNHNGEAQKQVQQTNRRLVNGNKS